MHIIILGLPGIITDAEKCTVMLHGERFAMLGVEKVTFFLLVFQSKTNKGPIAVSYILPVNMTSPPSDCPPVQT